jgi:hypothetical protein
MFTFPAGSAIFFYAGLAAAAGPILIHLLNRRRFRVVQWAAMDFLLEAMKRNRRILHLRDLLLLALRTAALVLFGLALAQPLLVAGRGGQLSPQQPVHAVLVVDNSLSMGFEKLDGTLLGEAKARAREFIDDLPDGSRVSVLPLCAAPGTSSPDAYRTKEDARDALEKIEPVDRGGGLAQAIELARQALAQAPEMEPRVVFVGDQQASGWPGPGAALELAPLAEMQVVSVSPQAPENSWIESFVLQDGVADVESPAVLTAVVRHEGPAPRPRIPVTLQIDGVEVESVIVDLELGQSREVAFKHRFEVPVEPGRPVFVPASVSLPHDRLPADDARHLAVPVVAALPVVFVDQYGREEDPRRARYGETRHLRRLLAPVTVRGDATRQLVEIVHRRIDELDRELLQTARLVVVAGVASPSGEGTAVVPLLREYVEQGGQLVIAAGAQFDPAAWQQAAWLDGGGILPAPLLPEPVGKTPQEAADELRPFFLNFASLSHDLFHVADAGRDELEELYGSAVFFKSVAADLRPAVIAALTTSESRRRADRADRLSRADQQLRGWAEQEAQGTLSTADRQQRDELLAQRGSLAPEWLTWSQNPELSEADPTAPSGGPAPAALAPRVLAAFDNQVPFLVERTIGRGHVVWVASGTFSDWNTLPKTNAVLVFDRLLRGMLERTLPRRNLSSAEPLTLPVNDRTARYEVTSPDGRTEPLGVDALAADRYGVSLRGVARRGVYKLTAVKSLESGGTETVDSKLWETAVAFNGPAAESEPAFLDAVSFKDRVAAAPLRWVGRGEAISLAGGGVRGQNLWKWILLAVLVCLLLEMAVLARPWWAREAQA